MERVQTKKRKKLKQKHNTYDMATYSCGQKCGDTE